MSLECPNCDEWDEWSRQNETCILLFELNGGNYSAPKVRHCPCCGEKLLEADEETEGDE